MNLHTGLESGAAAAHIPGKVNTARVDIPPKMWNDAFFVGNDMQFPSPFIYTHGSLPMKVVHTIQLD